MVYNRKNWNSLTRKLEEMKQKYLYSFSKMAEQKFLEMPGEKKAFIDWGMNRVVSLGIQTLLCLLLG